MVMGLGEGDFMYGNGDRIKEKGNWICLFSYKYISEWMRMSLNLAEIEGHNS